MSYPITHIDGLDEDDVGALKAVGIRTTERLLEQAKSPKGRKLLAGRTGIGEKRLLDFANAADHMRIKGMGKGYVGLLRAVGVMTVRDLQYRNPDYEGGANAESLRQAQRNFQSFGATSKDAISNVRKPTPEDKRKRNWKPL